MNRWNYIRQSLIHHRWIHLSVLLAVTTATTVLTGALIVGDSVRGSLKELGLGRLGRVDYTLISDRFFAEQRCDELTKKTEFQAIAKSAAPACVAPRTTVECRSTTKKSAEGQPTLRRANRVLLIGADARFWKLGDVAAPKIPGTGQVVVNQALADECLAQLGDTITIRLPHANPVPADSPLGRKDDRVSSLVGLTIIDIVPNVGLGEFTLYPSQQVARNAWVGLDVFANAVDQPGHVNAILVEAREPAPSTKETTKETTAITIVNTTEQIAKLNELLELSVSDFGISINQQSQTFGDKPIWDYWNVTSDRLVWAAAARDAVDGILATDQPQELFTFLTNSITVVRESPNDPPAEIPYSTITALENHPQLGPLQNDAGDILPALQDDEIAISSWAAERLQAKLGDTLRIAYFAPETLHGTAEERFADFRLAVIVPITEPTSDFRRDRPPEFDKAPTLANDPAMTPAVKGVTDQASINDWDPPFPFESDRIQPIDEEYWDRHRTTPKAFLSLAAGKKLWTSRLGGTTSFRVPTRPGVDEELLTQFLTPALRERQTELGFRFQPIRAQALAASAGTTPFEFLFLGFSMFLVTSALMLIAALFRLGLDLRAAEFGTLAAIGISAGKIRRMATGELTIVALAGALLGILGGVIYASIMLYGLRTWWLDAIVTPFLRLHVHPTSLLIGLGLSTLAAWVVVWVGLGRLKSASPRKLLAGRFPTSLPKTSHSRATDITKKKRPLLRILLAFAAAIGLVGTQLSGEAQAGAFFGSGALALTGMITAIHRWLRRLENNPTNTSPTNAGASTLSSLQLAWRNAARNPGRSTLTIALMAAASFLILAIAAFRLAPTNAGTGGFALMAESDQPIFDDLNLPDVRAELFGKSGAKDLEGVDIVRLRKRAGDDASCRNLYQSAQPQMLGISDQAIEYFEAQPDQFAWAAANTFSKNAWRCVVDHRDAETNTIPVILDKNTAMYALHLPPKLGHEFEMTYEQLDQPVRFRIAGLLGGTILQGNLIVHEKDLLALFPETGGYQSFLIRTPNDDSEQPKKTAALLEDRFGDEGLDVQESTEVLSGLLAVQNTYLSTFQSLGALGLLLGAVGLVAVQIRQVISRRGELALMSAMGMSPRWIHRQLIQENAVLLVAGLGSGILAAMVALIPHQWVGAASFPWGALTATFAGIFVLALAAAAFASRTVAKQPIVVSLRGE